MGLLRESNEKKKITDSLHKHTQLVKEHGEVIQMKKPEVATFSVENNNNTDIRNQTCGDNWK